MNTWEGAGSIWGLIKPKRDAASQAMRMMTGTMVDWKICLTMDVVCRMGRLSNWGQGRVYFAFSAFFALSNRSSFTKSFASGGFAILPMPYLAIMSVDICTSWTVTS